MTGRIAVSVFYRTEIRTAFRFFHCQCCAVFRDLPVQNITVVIVPADLDAIQIIPGDNDFQFERIIGGLFDVSRIGTRTRIIRRSNTEVIDDTPAECDHLKVSESVSYLDVVLTVPLDVLDRLYRSGLRFIDETIHAASRLAWRLIFPLVRNTCRVDGFRLDFHRKGSARNDLCVRGAVRRDPKLIIYSKRECAGGHVIVLIMRRADIDSFIRHRIGNQFCSDF